MARDILVETAYSHLSAVLKSIEPELLARENELFGDREDCTDEEAQIIFNDRLTHREKVAALVALRSGRCQ